MAIEESSVVAAAAKAAKYWGDRGGFKTEVLGEEKLGKFTLSIMVTLLNLSISSPK